MTNTATLTKTQFRTAAGVLSLAVLSEDGWVSEFAARTAGGAHLAALRALVAKGILVREMRPFTMLVGPLAGQEISTAFYSAS